MQYETRFCTHCAAPLARIVQTEDGGEVERLRCGACGWTHWNNPTPVLAAIVELDGKVLLARNAAWPGDKAFRPDHRLHGGGRARRKRASRARLPEETSLQVSALQLMGVYDFQRMNQVIIAYHAPWPTARCGSRPSCWSTA